MEGFFFSVEVVPEGMRAIFGREECFYFMSVDAGVTMGELLGIFHNGTNEKLQFFNDDTEQTLNVNFCKNIIESGKDYQLKINYSTSANNDHNYILFAQREGAGYKYNSTARHSRIRETSVKLSVIYR